MKIKPGLIPILHELVTNQEDKGCEGQERAFVLGKAHARVSQICSQRTLWGALTQVADTLPCLSQVQVGQWCLQSPLFPLLQHKYLICFEYSLNYRL